MKDRLKKLEKRVENLEGEIGKIINSLEQVNKHEESISRILEIIKGINDNMLENVKHTNYLFKYIRGN
jgi:t-SNARE complex subunit (syntaxin)